MLLGKISSKCLISLASFVDLAQSHHVLFHSSPSCPTRLIYQYPSAGTWFENIAVRSNGDLLLTSLNKPGGLSTLSPFDNHPPKQIVTSTELGYLNSTLGIVETERDVFYVIASNYSLGEGNVGDSIRNGNPALGNQRIVNAHLVNAPAKDLRSADARTHAAQPRSRTTS